IRECRQTRQDNMMGVVHGMGVARHHGRLFVAGLMRGGLKRLGGGVQIVGAVIDDGDAHRGAPDSGNRPMTSGRPGGMLSPVGGGGDAGATLALLALASSTQRAKKRRSPSSRSSPTTTPT